MSQQLTNEDVAAYNASLYISQEQREKDGFADAPTTLEVIAHEEEIKAMESASFIHIETPTGQVYHQDLGELPYKLGIRMSTYVKTKLWASYGKMQNEFAKMQDGGKPGEFGAEKLDYTPTEEHYGALCEMLLQDHPAILKELNFAQAVGVGEILVAYITDTSKKAGVTKK